jgi:hypothetical protein
MIDRQQRLQDVYVRINEHKDAQKETARLANEVRLMKMSEGRSLSPGAGMNKMSTKIPAVGK